MLLQSKIHVAGAKYKVFCAEVPNIDTHSPQLFNCHDKRSCAFS